ncbi:hypothetical protein SETIT_2G162300v2 [Setaria italica]|uniref:Uncharacterized protein n=1 Tax=Setaria italica TaxID=4555 RepID=A0A368Q006_SETIT|nr:hypothetical protein SETIT_2G162300v2 [Setaria italica]
MAGFTMVGEDLFKLDKERDQLTAAIGTTEHSGRVRGLSSTLPWGKAFQNDQASYKKWDHYKKDLEEKMREIANTYDQKAPSIEVDKFLNLLKKKKASSSSEKSVACGASQQMEKDENLNFFASDEVLENYEHGKPFLYRWDLLDGPWELNKLHGWIMKAMKQGIRAITPRIPKKVFLGVLDYEIVIDFEDLHELYRHQHLDVNLNTVWCL